MEDLKTVEYFNKFTPEYSLGRFDYTIDFLNKYAKREHILADIGCGNGNILDYIKQRTLLHKFIGIDISTKYLEQVKQRLNCQTYCGSILDEDFLYSQNIQCDFVVMGAILHHLVGKSRKQSWNNAQISIRNALILLKKNGYLIIHEPMFYPHCVMTVVFLTKMIISHLVSGRITIFGPWNNIGEPIVSYYTNEKLKSFFSSLPNVQLFDENIIETRFNKLLRLFLITRRTDTTFILKKI